MRRGRHSVAEIAELRPGSILDRIATNPGHHQKKRAVERKLSVSSRVGRARPILPAIHQIFGLISFTRIQVITLDLKTTRSAVRSRRRAAGGVWRRPAGTNQIRKSV